MDEENKTCFNNEHPLNTYSFIEYNEECNSIFSKDLQNTKACLPIEVIDEGISISFSYKDFAKRKAPIVVVIDEISTLFNNEQP